MTTLGTMASLRTANGLVVGLVHFPKGDEDALSIGLRLLTQQLIAQGHGQPQSGFGGEYGYGVDFENEMFLLHPFCWCEEDDCLWCGGSGCQVEIPHRPHSEACYQSRLGVLKEKYGHNATYDRGVLELCRELGCDYDYGREVHCTCGSDNEWKRAWAACDCDWHAGRGIYRFGRATSAPHFWYKPTGLQVRWYKYIGRDNDVVVGSSSDWRSILINCLASVGAPPLEEAAADYERAEIEAAEVANRRREWMAFMGDALKHR